MRIKIAPSLLAADWLRIGQEVASVEDAGADLLHFDVIDGHFAPNLTLGQQAVRAVASVARVPLDVHLMLDNPGDFIEEFAQAGAAILGFHVEVTRQPGQLIERVRACGKQVSLVLCPGTPAEAVKDYLDSLDQVLVMSVHPGFGGQDFIPQVLDKVSAIRSWGPRGLDIEVDGGITPLTARAAVAAGANVLVAGTACFGRADRAAAIRALRG